MSSVLEREFHNYSVFMLIHSFLFSIGAHIGSLKYTCKDFYKPFLVGYKNGYCIFSMHSILYSIRKSAFFFFSLGKNFCRILFYYHGFSQWNFILGPFFYRWLNETNNFFFDEPWRYGILSNMQTYSKTLFYELFKYEEKMKAGRMFLPSKKISFFNFFFHILFYTSFRKNPGVKWFRTIKSLQKFWRFFLFFKFYKFLNRLPDAFFFLSSKNYWLPVNEAYHLKIPTISSLDTDYSFYNFVTYPLLLNSRSSLTHIFLFIVMMKSFQHGELASYSNFKHTAPM